MVERMSAWAEDWVELRIGSLRGFEATAACALGQAGSVLVGIIRSPVRAIALPDKKSVGAKVRKRLLWPSIIILRSADHQLTMTQSKTAALPGFWATRCARCRDSLGPGARLLHHFD